jgi:hypothetical protein
MRDFLHCGKGSCIRRLLFVLTLLACFSPTAMGASSITGSVRDQTHGKPAVGDEVILVRLDKEMQEEARVKTDAQGAFTLLLQYPDKSYLVRVVHQGVRYDRPASAGDALSIQVFDAARHVQGVTGSIEILRTGTRGNVLHVSDMYEIKNESSPPLTQVGERTFEAYLPAKAKMTSILAAGPGSIGEMISASHVPGEPGHYTVNFPLLPGATKFAFNYDLPYDGHATFQTRHAYALQQLAVMIPPTMKFLSRSPAFQILATGNSRYQVQAANQLTAGEGPEFGISGTGALSPLRDEAKPQARPHSSAAPDSTLSVPSRAALPSLASVDPGLKQAPPPSQSLVLGGVTALLLGFCVLLVWRARKARDFPAAQTLAQRVRQRNPPHPDRRL